MGNNAFAMRVMDVG